MRLPLINLIISTICGLIMLIVGSIGFNFIYSKIMYLVISIMIISFSIIGLVRVLVALRRNDVRKLGEVSMTHSWCLFSTGLGGLMTYLAPLFQTGGSPAFTYTALAVSIIVLIVNVTSITYAKTRLKIPLTI